MITLTWLLLFRRFRHGLISRHEEMIRADSLRIKSEIAGQVGHDIRAPLAALTVLSAELQQLPDANRALLKSAIDRIQSIAKSLLESQQTDHPTATSSIPQVTRIGVIAESWGFEDWSIAA